MTNYKVSVYILLLGLLSLVTKTNAYDDKYVTENRTRVYSGFSGKSQGYPQCDYWCLPFYLFLGSLSLYFLYDLLANGRNSLIFRDLRG